MSNLFSDFYLLHFQVLDELRRDAKRKTIPLCVRWLFGRFGLFASHSERGIEELMTRSEIIHITATTGLSEFSIRSANPEYDLVDLPIEKYLKKEIYRTVIRKRLFDWMTVPEISRMLNISKGRVLRAERNAIWNLSRKMRGDYCDWINSFDNPYREKHFEKPKRRFKKIRLFRKPIFRHTVIHCKNEIMCTHGVALRIIKRILSMGMKKTGAGAWNKESGRLIGLECFIITSFTKYEKILVPSTQIYRIKATLNRSFP